MKLEVSKDLEAKLAKALAEKIDYSMKDAINDTVEELRRTTPIDTGYARSRWTSYEVTSFKISFSFANKYLFNFTENNHIIANDADYIQYLNAGSSKQAPAFFVEKALLKGGFVPTQIK